MHVQVHHPELIPRRGEIIAWLLFAAILVTWLSLVMLSRPVHWGLPVLTVFLLLASLSISLGNWSDRNTHLGLDESGIAFTNGLRKVCLKWEEVREVRVHPAVWGKKVQVFGDKSYFDYHTLGEVKYQGEVKGRTGFMQGEAILQHILENSGLQVASQLGSVVYYARK